PRQKRSARLGYLEFAPPGVNDTTEQVFLDGLRELGWVDGQNLSVEYRYAYAAYERLDPAAAELAALNVNVIVSTTATGAVAAKKATSTIPIVFGGIGDPLGNGLVESFAHPGANATGTSSLVEGLTRKHFELLKECVPTLARVAALRNPTVGEP